MPDFSFDSVTQRYRNKLDGKFVSDKKIQSVSQKLLENSKANMSSTVDDLIADRADMRTFMREFADQIKTMHLHAYMLGRGGLKRMTPRDYGIVGAKVRQEYRYLEKFAKDIASGKLSEAQIRARSNLYAGSSKSSYERGRRESHITSNSFHWEKRNLAVAKHCGSCLAYAGSGWQKIGFFPGIGEKCECLSNCACSFSYSKDKPDSTGISLPRFGWLHDRRRPWSGDAP